MSDCSICVGKATGEGRLADGTRLLLCDEHLLTMKRDVVVSRKAWPRRPDAPPRSVSCPACRIRLFVDVPDPDVYWCEPCGVMHERVGFGVRLLKVAGAA